LLQRALKAPRHVAPTLQRFLYDIELDAEQIKRELEAEKGAIAGHDRARRQGS
jgi:hypothetical protein